MGTGSLVVELSGLDSRDVVLHFDGDIWWPTDVPARLKLWHRCTAQPTTFKRLGRTKTAGEVLHTAALICRTVCLFEFYPHFSFAILFIWDIATRLDVIRMIFAYYIHFL